MKKKSFRKAANNFKVQLDRIERFIVQTKNLSEEHISWCHSFAVIKLYKEFEDLMLNCLIAALNNDTKHLSTKTQINFPKHLTDEVCEYLIIGDGYFDFKGRSGLIETLKRFVDDNHFIIPIVKDNAYKKHLDELSALRNFAAHKSARAKAKCLGITGQKRIKNSGSWLKKKSRLQKIIGSLRAIADRIETAAPY